MQRWLLFIAQNTTRLLNEARDKQATGSRTFEFTQGYLEIPHVGRSALAKPRLDFQRSQCLAVGSSLVRRGLRGSVVLAGTLTRTMVE